MIRDCESEFTAYEAEKQINIFTTTNKVQELDMMIEPTVDKTPRCSFDYVGATSLLDLN